MQITYLVFYNDNKPRFIYDTCIFVYQYPQIWKLIEPHILEELNIKEEIMLEEVQELKMARIWEENSLNGADSIYILHY